MASIQWLDEVERGGVDDGALDELRHGSDYDRVMLAEVFEALNSHPWREAVISMHRTPNAAKAIRRRRLTSPRWVKPGVSLRTRRVGPGQRTAVTAVYAPVRK